MNNQEHTKKEAIAMMYPQIAYAIQAIDDEVGISLTEICSATRKHQVCVARMVLASILYEVPAVVLAEYIGHHHASISYYRIQSTSKVRSDGNFKRIHNKVLNRYNEIKNVQNVS